MPDAPAIEPGLRGSAQLVVSEEHTAFRVGSGRVRVLATPVMINLIEAAALAAVEHRLPDGCQTLGTHLDVRHTRATPVGMTVTAHAELVGVEGRTLTFRVTCADDVEAVGEGTHERVVVNLARCDERLRAKLERHLAAGGSKA